MTELELADLLQVSRTPVRVMLGLLRELGIVTALPNRGQVLAKSSDALRAFVLPEAHDSDATLHATIIRDRLAGRLEEEPSQADLARRYDVSPATVQRLFQRLEQEGLVQRTGWRWSFLPSLGTVASQRASYQIRQILEPASLLLPEFMSDVAVLDQLQEEHQHLLDTLLEKVEVPIWIFNLDARFHETIAGFGQNSFILNVIRQQNALRRLLEIRSYSDQTRVQAWAKEHTGIIAAVRLGELEKASHLLSAHLGKADRFLGGLAVHERQGNGN
ncbi:GntR family transcriptional regulator [Acidisoma silvae]|uniref:GntR family transcriptional regulator n=1 Tax=Acidisoma silvae TaxID=2802396 RepID=A0A963YYE5_9PROT|nr:GntR family transcriptional regulator [Acidisoma silvae]MCB8878540.1 GntR family transcriptional regulator [Acidisoma silvae]